jgi:hypothetical protein
LKDIKSAPLNHTASAIRQDNCTLNANQQLVQLRYVFGIENTGLPHFRYGQADALTDKLLAKNQDRHGQQELSVRQKIL